MDTLILDYTIETYWETKKTNSLRLAGEFQFAPGAGHKPGAQEHPSLKFALLRQVNSD